MIRQKIEQVRDRDPELADRFQRMADNGKPIAELLQRAFAAGRNRDDAEFESICKKLESLGPTDWEMDKARQQFEDGVKRGPEPRYNPNRAATPGLAAPDYDPKRSVPFNLRNLSPSSGWTIMIDETGRLFDKEGVANAGRSEESGKMVSLLIPDGCSLPRLVGGEHAVDEGGFRASEKRLGAVFSASPRCGILGITLEGMSFVQGSDVDYWYMALERSFDLVLRLLPLPELGIANLHFYVEAHNVDIKGLGGQRRMVKRALDACLYRLAKADPVRADRIKADVGVDLKKGGRNEMFRAYNGYVDSIANAWNGKSEHLKADLERYGLYGSCLLRGTTQSLAEIMDSVDAGVPIDPPKWSELVELVAKNGPDSVPAAVLDRIAKQIRKEGARKDRKLRWFPSLVAEVQSRLDSRDVRLGSISAQVEWLHRNAPKEAELPKRLRLLWQTIRLSEANHRGLTKSQLEREGVSMDEFRGLAGELYCEDAPLSTWAMLHLAVSKTDAFRFEEARDFLLGFVRDNLFGPLPGFGTFPDQRNETICAGPGLRNYGKILSSLGQHEAFLGRPASAVPLFEKALGCFSRLSENSGRDIRKTRAYLCTALMDDPKSDTEKLRGTLKSYLGGTICEKGRELAASHDPDSAYPHHVLLRYLVSGRASRAEMGGYLSAKGNWFFMEDGHPWEMIAFYRAMLVSDPAERKDWLTRAANVAVREKGGTIQAISAVIHGALLACGTDPDGTIRHALEDAVAVVRREIGDAFGEDRYAALRKQLDPATRCNDPLVLARTVLPFNFR